MIPSEDWTVHGIWGDLGTPSESAVYVPLVGAWESYLIDVSPGVEHLGRVTHGHVYWEGKLPPGSGALCDVLVNDTGEWQLNLSRGSPILRAEEWNEVSNPSVRVRIKVVWVTGDIRPVTDAQITSVAVVLSRKGSMAWEPEDKTLLGWRGST